VKISQQNATDSVLSRDTTPLFSDACIKEVFFEGANSSISNKLIEPYNDADLKLALLMLEPPYLFDIPRAPKPVDSVNSSS
jgi:hypothetical protein